MLQVGEPCIRVVFRKKWRKRGNRSFWTDIQLQSSTVIYCLHRPPRASRFIRHFARCALFLAFSRDCSYSKQYYSSVVFIPCTMSYCFEQRTTCCLSRGVDFPSWFNGFRYATILGLTTIPTLLGVHVLFTILFITTRCMHISRSFIFGAGFSATRYSEWY